ncbi:MAG: CBS domain-containing protein [Actinomycetota bacterium]|jgi:CBS domain-containing protein|nr:CBS domain-containing protein [Actinomycetota bacterium]MDA8166587.1 CBS domain-containing protein [Actinomycetota bacterium]
MEASSEKKEPTAAEIMTADAVTVHENAKVHEVAQLMSEHNISGVPVVNDNHQVVGIVTEGDMVEMDADIHFPHYINFLDSVIFLESTRKFDKRVRHVFASSVRDIMTTEVETVQKETPLHEIATLMSDRKVNRLPVLDGDKLVGIVTRADVVRAMAG